MKRKSFILYTDMVNVVRLLTPEQRGNLFLAIFDFADGKEPTFDDAILKIAFESIKLPLLRDNEKYENKAKANAENGKKGGRPRKDVDCQVDTEETDDNPKKPVGYSETQKNPKKPKKADSDSDSDSDSVNDSDSDSVSDKDKDNKENLPTNLFGDESLDSGKDEELKAEFDVFRKKYPGNEKKGIDTEWAYFKKKHKDYKTIVPILNDSLDVIIIRRESRKKLKLFVPEWKYFRTWINGRCWEEAFEESEADIQAKKIIDVKLGVDEKIENGRRTYGTGRVTVPMDARPRPAENYQWSNPQNDWVYSI